MNFRNFLLLHEMSSIEAQQILGVSNKDSPEEIKKKYRKLAMINHPDKGGNHENFIKISHAFEVLSGKAPETRPYIHQPTPSYGDFDPWRPKPNERPRTVPIWEPDLRSFYNGIDKQDFTDVNYFKKKIWEAASVTGLSVFRTKITAFDGAFCRASITVFGNTSVIPLMGKAMEIYNSNGPNPYATEAVFIQEAHNPQTVKIIRINKKNVNINLDFDSFNENPYNDPTFNGRLKDIIEKYKTGRGRLDIKA